MKNILITGGLGFIGSHFARLLINSGYNISILDKNTYAADIRRIEDIRYKAKLYIGDICDRKLVEKITREHNIDTIINFGAETHVDNAIKDSKQFIHSNIAGVQNLLEIARKSDIKRFVQISTDEVYGSTDEVYGSTEYDNCVFKETDKLNPGNPYSASKAAADLLALSYHKTYGLDTVITRSSNNYGEWQHQEKFISRMIALAMKGKDLEVYGDGENIRDWLYVKDNCLGIKKVMENGRSGEIYNIGGGDEKTNNEVAKFIAKKFGVGIKYIEDRKGHDFRYSISCNKIRNELGWEAKTSFEDGIKKTVDFYVKRC